MKHTGGQGEDRDKFSEGAGSHNRRGGFFRRDDRRPAGDGTEKRHRIRREDEPREAPPWRTFDATAGDPCQMLRLHVLPRRRAARLPDALLLPVSIPPVQRQPDLLIEKGHFIP